MAHYIIFGDSIGCGQNDPDGGWVKLLAEKYPLKNLSIDGATTADYVKNFPNIDKNSILIIALGINDAAKLTLKDYRRNLIQLIKLARKYTQKIIFVGPAPVDQPKVDPVPWAPEISYKTDLVKQFSETMGKVAQKEKLKFMDLFNLLSAEYLKTLDDGLHPNHSGHEKIYKIIYQNL